MAKPVLISFCTTCHNRAYQLKQVFAANAEVVAAHPDVEWVIWNHSSEDDLDAYLRKRLPKASRRIRYAWEPKRRAWHASVAKNISHRLARGRYLMNLDCDNRIANAVEVIRAGLRRRSRLLHLWSGRPHDGTYGRIAVERRLFHRLRGYDEAFLPMGHQDVDLIQRAVASGWGEPALHASCGRKVAVQNSKAASVRHCRGLIYDWAECAERNHSVSQVNLVLGRFRANAATGWEELDPRWLQGAQP